MADMSWQSLNLLKENLGNIGEGVIGYLNNRREEARRQQNFTALKSYFDTPEGQQLGEGARGMAQLAFPANNYDAMATLKAIRPQTQILAGAMPGQYQVAKTNATGDVNIGPAGGPGQGQMNPEDMPVGVNGLPPHIDSHDKADIYRSYLQSLKSGVDTYNASEQGKTQPRTFSPKLQNQLELLENLHKNRINDLTEQNTIRFENAKKMVDYREEAKKREESNFDPAMIEREAKKYYATGALPSIGMGGGPLKTAIMKRAAQIGLEQGETDPQMAGAIYQTHLGALKNLQTQYASMKARENAAELNLDMALKLSESYPRTSYPALNKFKNWYAEKLDNNPKYTQLENAVYAGAREYAKLASGAYTSGQPLSDHAVDEVDRLLNTAQTHEQFAGAVDIMRQDMRNVPAGFQQQLSAEADLIRNVGMQRGGGSQPRPAPTGGKRSRWNMQTQQLEPGQ